MNTDNKKNEDQHNLHCAYCKTDAKMVGEWHQDINLAYKDKNDHLKEHNDHDVKIMDKQEES
jgi:cytochrome c551/c552